MRVFPLHDWLVVQVEPFDKRSSIIELPGQNESAIRKGVIMEIGPGKQRNDTVGHVPFDVNAKPGQKICFLRWHAEHRPGKAQTEALAKWSAEIGKDLVMIRENDILFFYDGDVKVDI